TCLQHSMVATGFHYDRGEWVTRTLSSIERLFNANVRGIRRLGSAALDLAWVACGRLDGFFEYKLSPWDYAAGILVVTEAGGDTLDRFGNPIELHSGGTIATNGRITDDLLDLIRW
ncbi:MAG: hypothetical protein KDB27_25160, partial [Planctomycetales bacterium]|nr:hypothetical protein [Planctomycetales bacterium]